MVSTVIRFYRHQRDDDPNTLVGVVEPLEKQDRLAFHNKEELWEILQALSTEEKNLPDP
jgi:hypothetical protein